MKTLLLITLCAFVPALAQNPVLNGIMNGGRLREMQSRSQRDDAETRLLRLEAERLQLEIERLKRGTTSPLQPTPDQVEAAQRQINDACVRLQQRFPDFQRYLPALERLARIFEMGRSTDFTIDRYLEGLYFIAKHASFVEQFTSSTPTPTTP
jgi:hypothetical protein